MNFYLAVLKKYAVFTGRSTRQEFWMYMLINVIISIVLSILDTLVGTVYSYHMPDGTPVKLGGLLQNLYGLAVFIPGLAVQVRRLHDVNKSGKLLLLFLVPVVVAVWAALSVSIAMLFVVYLVLLGFVIWIIVLFSTKGTVGPNKYGEDPEGGGFKFSFEEDEPKDGE